jgi:hypothetical protein
MSSNATGPRTEAGKARSSQNAVKHGLCSQRAVIPGEDPAEWDAFRGEVVCSLGPSGFLQRELAERVALQMWRQRRVARYEAELVAAAYAEEEGGPETGDTRAPLLERARLLKEALDRVVRYESHVSRQLKEALKTLRECQAQPGIPACPAPATAAAPTVPPPPEGRAAAGPSSFRQADAAARALRRIEASLPRPGVSFADYDLVPKTPAAKT